ncbi:MAG TPA: RusA family crossover junction endodeoxyribonuclease [Actinobacteria bacterium]|nr:RusA family crossover junction endodeoxyribonuclease [Actinomycetes bacterium]HEX21424.1 RusA family crossover junction endodeoxyribonuclease [Actinomycetota bacterium]
MKKFIIPGHAKPKGRPRIIGKRAITPEPTRRWEEKVGWYAKHGGIQMIPKSEVLFTAKFYFSNRQHGDLSNLIKAIEDGLNWIAYKDDKQIRRYGTGTGIYYCKGKKNERVEVEICELERAFR